MPQRIFCPNTPACPLSCDAGQDPPPPPPRTFGPSALPSSSYASQSSSRCGGFPPNTLLAERFTPAGYYLACPACMTRVVPCEACTAIVPLRLPQFKGDGGDGDQSTEGNTEAMLQKATARCRACGFRSLQDSTQRVLTGIRPIYPLSLDDVIVVQTTRFADIDVYRAAKMRQLGILVGEMAKYGGFSERLPRRTSNPSGKEVRTFGVCLPKQPKFAAAPGKPVDFVQQDNTTDVHDKGCYGDGDPDRAHLPTSQISAHLNAKLRAAAETTLDGRKKRKRQRRKRNGVAKESNLQPQKTTSEGAERLSPGIEPGIVLRKAGTTSISLDNEGITKSNNPTRTVNRKRKADCDCHEQTSDAHTKSSVQQESANVSPKQNKRKKRRRDITHVPQDAQEANNHIAKILVVRPSGGKPAEHGERNEDRDVSAAPNAPLPIPSERSSKCGEPRPQSLEPQLQNADCPPRPHGNVGGARRGGGGKRKKERIKRRAAANAAKVLALNHEDARTEIDDAASSRDDTFIYPQSAGDPQSQRCLSPEMIQIRLNALNHQICECRRQISLLSDVSVLMQRIGLWSAFSEKSVVSISDTGKRTSVAERFFDQTKAKLLQALYACKGENFEDEDIRTIIQSLPKLHILLSSMRNCSSIPMTVTPIMTSTMSMIAPPSLGTTVENDHDTNTGQLHGASAVSSGGFSPVLLNITLPAPTSPHQETPSASASISPSPSWCAALLNAIGRRLDRAYCKLLWCTLDGESESEERRRSVVLEGEGETGGHTDSVNWEHVQGDSFGAIEQSALRSNSIEEVRLLRDLYKSVVDFYLF